ncbi:ChaN family lipoprotein [Maritimibacter sp. DP1N21-5]|uniref:ChaN family lipoprotein n=1 Tax=Maritimibacter sp. DP1N21-5 TaxID=2836867 RepID=UPI001C4656D0|nr:ChaN family lipoprotein [Maritimibacter sp. DP1N21-5]MBV7408590.1 ChaN family lipoprotein [Maritimibacter sp. DP1N21-5]
MWKILACLAALLPLTAQGGPLEGVEGDIFILGEVHDNPAHHEAQAEAIIDIEPRAVVFEMLTIEQAGRITDALLDDAEALGEALGWAESGWPDFDMYYPVFTAARGSWFVGAAVPRDRTSAVLENGLAAAFGDAADLFGLTEPLDEEQLAARLNLQMEAHCGMLPPDLLPGMVDIQRLRDATLAQAAIVAQAETGGPVAVITGNGHAREDWGVPAYIARVAPELTVVTLGQGEDGGTPDGGFDTTLDAPAAPREDPCKAFE